MDLLETDGQLIIVNRSTEHHISKKLICKIPYFAKIFIHDLKESKENKVVLDFDEQAFKLILNWFEFRHVIIEMKSVINLCSMVDYFSPEDNLVEDCTNYFHDNFSIGNLPVVIRQVTATSKLVNSDSLDVFIRRYFLQIANTTVWLDYPIETIEYICKKDLMVYSEIQVFDAIMKWVNFKADSRKCHLEKLLQLVRWCHLDDKDLSKIMENEIFKPSGAEVKYYSASKSYSDCTFNRTKQNYFIEIYELNDTSLRIIVLDFDLAPVINKVIELNELMPLNLLHEGHFTDIAFDSGRQGIRIDWKRNEYRLLDPYDYKSLCIKTHLCIPKEVCEKNYQLGTQYPQKILYEIKGSSILEANEKFILLSTKSDYFYCWSSANAELIEEELIDTEFHNHTNFLATVLDNNIYLLNHKTAFIQFNIDDGDKNIIKLPRFIKGSYSDMILTSRQAFDDRVFLVNKITKDVFCFDVNTQKWSSMGRFANCNSDSTAGQSEPDKLLTFTSAFLPIDFE